MSTSFAILKFALFVTVSECRDTIWHNSMENGTGFFSPFGTVHFDVNSNFCSDNCAQITVNGSLSHSYLQTAAIDTAGYEDIYLHITFALGGGWSNIFFRISYFPDLETEPTTALDTIVDFPTAYNINTKYEEVLHLEYVRNTSTLQIWFWTITTGSNSQGTAFVDNISVTGSWITSFPTTSRPTSNEPTQYPLIPAMTVSDEPTNDPSLGPTDMSSTNPSNIPSRSPTVILTPTFDPTAQHTDIWSTIVSTVDPMVVIPILSSVDPTMSATTGIIIPWSGLTNSSIFQLDVYVPL